MLNATTATSTPLRVRIARQHPSTPAPVVRRLPRQAVAWTPSPSRKRARPELSTKKLSMMRHHLRARLDRSDRIWAGRCGCKSPTCMADEFIFSESSEEEEAVASLTDEPTEDSDQDYDMETHENAVLKQALAPSVPQDDDDDTVPTLMHLLLMF
ncbi:hypothetical protein Poli38472_013670 [Pythium oligandrum]|uniref:Uncharacterized protein n=1 Tax=Pythium oligandrum TaxID=41045 RepID=A0A8K1CDE0_PYTOL|nr:hypothetical protein Poli38472_013670 [Pythium oligandrum]|eukprot:TMW61207.1 hypothetical protein Poli38472_013670 [Pythium oligandrum]